MKIKIYVNTDVVSEQFPQILTEKQYERKREELVKARLDKENLKYDYGFEDFLDDCDYGINKVFFLDEEEKTKILNEFALYAFENAKAEMENYYEEYEIEI